MENKKYQVFVSSTHDDLSGERQEVIRALLQINCIPSGMELFPASDDDAWSLIKTVIDDSDYYIVISAARYGSEHPESGISYTEMEYDYAVKNGIPVLGFLHGDPGKIPNEKSERSDEKIEKLEKFQNKIKKKLVRFWTTPAELAQSVGWSLSQEIIKKPGIGWARANKLSQGEAELEIAKLKQELSEIKLQRSLSDHDTIDLIKALEPLNEKFNIEVAGRSFEMNLKDISLLVLFGSYMSTRLSEINRSAGLRALSLFTDVPQEIAAGHWPVIGGQISKAIIRMEALGLLEQEFDIIPRAKGGGTHELVIKIPKNIRRAVARLEPFYSSKNFIKETT